MTADDTTWSAGRITSRPPRSARTGPRGRF